MYLARGAGETGKRPSNWPTLRSEGRSSGSLFEVLLRNQKNAPDLRCSSLYKLLAKRFQGSIDLMVMCLCARATVAVLSEHCMVNPAIHRSTPSETQRQSLGKDTKTEGDREVHTTCTAMGNAATTNPT